MRETNNPTPNKGRGMISTLSRKSSSKSKLLESSRSKLIDSSHSQYGGTKTGGGGSVVPIRGFGTQSSRFQSSNTENPGPGYYHDESKISLEKYSPSLSKKGYSNGFVSSENNRDEFLGQNFLGEKIIVSCPGLYKIPGAMDYTQKTKNRKGASLPFLPGPGDRVPFCVRNSIGPEGGKNYRN